LIDGVILKNIIVSLSISAEEYQRLYEGSAKTVFAHSIDGRSIRFPAGILRPFVLHTGVRGTFQINFDDDNRFHSIERLA
jgi:hypothetical protein